MIKYVFQTIANNNVVKKRFNKKVDRYFSEIMELEEIKKYEPKKQTFLILLGGKNVGKSYWAFQELLEVLKNGGRVCYMRNTLEEIKAMKVKLAGMVKDALKINVRVTDECITDEDRTKVLVNFIQAKNYNKLSGNLEGYDLLFYDEFNQILNVNAINKINVDFFNIINTAFRNHKIRVIACGNTKTKNNLFFNKFNISPKQVESNIEVMKVKGDSILFISYLNTAFKKVNGAEEDFDLIKKYDRLNYNSMFLGNAYEADDDAVINNFESIKNDFQVVGDYFIKDERLYQVLQYKQHKPVYFVHKTEVRVTLDLIEKLAEQGSRIYAVERTDYLNLSDKVSSVLDIQNEYINKLRAFQLFFDNYDLYYYFKEAQFVANDFIKNLTKL